MNRTLKAILFADLVDYSRHVSRHEDETLDFMQNCFEVFRAKVLEYSGNVIKTTGDGVVVEFESASDAVEYAMAMHESVASLQGVTSDEALFRVGIHLGEVQHQKDDVYGHAVNVAARLEAQARSGGICVSHDVYRQARRGTSYDFVAGGTPRLKNIAEPIPIYHVIRRPDGAGRSISTDIILIHVLDGFSLAPADGGPMRLRSHQACALLGYLALAPHYHDSQGRLAALIWPERDTKTARQALLRCLRMLRTSLDRFTPSVLRRQGDQIGLEEALLEVDLPSIYQNISLGKVDELLLERDDWSEMILLGFEHVSKLYKSWLEVTRHNWRRRVTEALEACLVRFDPGEIEVGRAAKALLILEPSHERAVQALIRHHLANRNPTRAFEVFETFKALLRDRYNMVPSEETLAIAELITREKRQIVEPLATRSVPYYPLRIGLGTFSTESDPDVEEHLAQGFRSELLVNLSRFREWIVIELDSDVTAGQSTEVPEYLLSARCGKTHGHHQLVVMLMETETHRVVWSDTFDMSIHNWFESQRRVVKSIAARLEVYVSWDRLTRLVTMGKADSSVYDDWLRGEHLTSLWDPAAEDEAAELFEGIIASNSDFAPAYASLAGIYNVRHLIRPGFALDAESEQKAVALGRRAVELDPLNPRSHLIVGWSTAMIREFEQSSVHFDLAISLNRNSIKSLLSCAQGSAFIGFTERAAELLNEAFALAPMFLEYQWCYIASTRYFLGDYEGAVIAAQRGANATLDTPGWRAAALSRLGRLEDAKRAFAEQVALIEPVWSGHDKATPQRTLEWFLDAFPMRLDADRKELTEALTSALP